MKRSFRVTVSALGATAIGLAAAVGAPVSNAQQAAPVPVFVRNGLPGAEHKRLEALVGDWDVDKYTYIAGGTPDKPLRSGEMRARRAWIADGRYVEDVTEGSMGDSKYFRKGFLGYSVIDKRYEWATADAVNANLMIYRSKAGDRAKDISLAGVFTDQGVTGERNAGKQVPMRTVIRIESPDRHVYELYMTPPGGREILADRMIFTRRK